MQNRFVAVLHTKHSFVSISVKKTIRKVKKNQNIDKKPPIRIKILIFSKILRLIKAFL